MSTFEVKVYMLKIEPHNNADTLELAVVGDYRSIVRKGQFVTGDLGVYIPEGAIVPDWLIEKIGLTGKLAGPQKNRVKAMKLRGILSQGLIVPLDIYPFHTYIDKVGRDFKGERVGVARPLHDDDGRLVEGDGAEVKFAPLGTDVAEFLGITKYEPPIPVHMAGEVFAAHGYTLKYDIENIKKFPDAIPEGEMVLITEKLHGTWTCFGYHPDIGHPIVTSKGLSGQGLAFKFNDANADNLYIRSLLSTADADGDDALDRLQKEFVAGLPFYILGETYGKGVQDLHYGLTKPHFRAFDIYVGQPGGEGRYLNGHEFMSACNKIGLEMVPVLYHGPFSKAIVNEFTDGKDNVTGAHMREGVVVRGLIGDKYLSDLGRVILKSVSEAYLLRKGDATEYN